MQQSLYLSDAIAATKQIDLLGLIEPFTQLRKVAAREYAGPCPKCGGTDRFRVNLDKGWFCRQCQDEEHWHDQLDFRQWIYDERIFTALEKLLGRRITDPEQIKRIQQERQARDDQRIAEEREKQAGARQKLNTSRVWERYHANLTDQTRELWRLRGIPDRWQDYYKVGYCPSRGWSCGDVRFNSDSLTIPYLHYTGPMQYDCIGLKHRLLIDNAPGGKYRQELSGLGTQIYTPWYEEKLNRHVLIVEGEIKAMVVFISLWMGEEIMFPDLSVVGVAGKSYKGNLLFDAFKECEKLWICLDPDAGGAAQSMARSLGKERCRILTLPDKIDDLINLGVLDGWKILELMEA